MRFSLFKIKRIHLEIMSDFIKIFLCLRRKIAGFQLKGSFVVVVIFIVVVLLFIVVVVVLLLVFLLLFFWFVGFFFLLFFNIN